MFQRAKDKSAPFLPPEARSGQEAQNSTPESKAQFKNAPDAGDGRRVSAHESNAERKPRHHKEGAENTQPPPDVTGGGPKP